MAAEPQIEASTQSLIESQLIAATKPSLRKDPELRLTVVETLYYQQPGIDPIQIDAGFSYFVQENEQLFQRTTFAGEDWSESSTGWLDKAHTVLIKNVHELRSARNPTAEEKAESLGHWIEVRLEDSKYIFSIAPKESMRFRINDLKSLRIRSAKGQTRFLYILSPE